MITLTEGWQTAYPGAAVGILAMEPVVNLEHHPDLEKEKRQLEAELRSRFGALDRSQLKNHPLLAPYTSYYRQYDKTYHVQHQLESIVFKGKSIPQAAALVEAMFMAELRHLVLTAGHDQAALRGGLILDAASGTETYETLAGQMQTLKRGDMFIRDEEGVLSSILYGPDRRTRITAATTRVIFTAYVPAGVPPERVEAHLGDLRDFTALVSPDARVVSMVVLPGA